MKWHDICCVAFSVHAAPQHGFGPSVRGGIILAKSFELEPSIFINCRQWCRLLASCTVCQMNAITPSVIAGRFWIQFNQYSSCLADGTLHILSGWSRRSWSATPCPQLAARVAQACRPGAPARHCAPWKIFTS